MKDVTEYIIRKGNKFWCDTEDEGDLVIAPGDKCRWTDAKGNVLKGVASTNFKGRNDDMVEIILTS